VSERNILKKLHRPSKKGWIIIILLIVILLMAMLAMHQFRGDEAVEFKVLGDTEIPQDIVGQVIPEYRDLERALACVVGDKVYVLVSRGEKPTSGFEVNIEKMLLEEEDGVLNLAVYANFSDPEPGTALTQILTYPLKVVETSLTQLPDQIELRVQYKQ
jgi:hypothetical protein